jgi:lipopolysaccharide transport system permease protein
MKDAMSTYLLGIWQARYFWSHLCLSDLRARFRRSFLGASWSVVQPLGMTLLISVVFSKMFHISLAEYAPYILSGLVLWEFVIGTAVGGAWSFVQADAYIKQCHHPLAIYTLRTTLANLIVFGMGSLSLVLWVLSTSPQHVNWSWLAALLVFPIGAMIAWPLATTLAYVSARFRDLPHALGLLFQALWFVSPVYFEVRMFRANGLQGLVDYNPIYHLLEIVRAPLLRGAWPSAENFAYCLGTIAALVLLAWLVGRKAEKKVIFYL